MKCEVCGNEYEAKRASSKFCSSTCRSKANRVSVATEVSVAPSEPVSVAEVPLKEVSVAKRTPLEELHAIEPGVDLDIVGVTTLDLAKDLKLDIKKDLGCMGFSEDGIFILPDITIEQVRNVRRLVEAKRGWKHREYGGAQGAYTSGTLLPGALSHR